MVMAGGLASSLVLFAVLAAPSQALETPIDPLLPGPVRTIIREVPVPGPVQTIIKRVPVPGPVQTIIRTTPTPVPGPVRTIIITASPQPARTVFVTIEPSPIGQPPQPRATLSNGTPVPQLTPAPVQTFVTSSPSPVIVPGPERVVTKERRIEVSVPQAIGLSVGLVLIGSALGLFALYSIYYFGRKDEEKQEVNRLQNLADELFGK